MLRRTPGAPTRVPPPTSSPVPSPVPSPASSPVAGPLSRRALLRRTGVIAAAPVVVTATGGVLAGSVSPAAAATATASGTECLADLIEQGAVSRADLLA